MKKNRLFDYIAQKGRRVMDSTQHLTKKENVDKGNRRLSVGEET